jgi:bifunctional DNA-binding transcriptional regulator/antitoxin component of YhaV-PrlF toxin-antitoxin module
MKGRKTNEYTNENGNKVSVFELTGTPAEISAYEAHQGANLRKSDSGKPLFFATRQALGLYKGDVVDVIKPEKLDNYIIDKTAERQVNDLLEAHAGTALGDALAKAEAERMLARARSGQSKVSAPVENTSTEDSAE